MNEPLLVVIAAELHLGEAVVALRQRTDGWFVDIAGQLVDVRDYDEALRLGTEAVWALAEAHDFEAKLEERLESVREAVRSAIPDPEPEPVVEPEPEPVIPEPKVIPVPDKPRPKGPIRTGL